MEQMCKNRHLSMVNMDLFRISDLSDQWPVTACIVTNAVDTEDTFGRITRRFQHDLT